VRTRDEARLAMADVVVDVGGVYDAARHRYDHHQKGFTETFGYGFSTKLSSAGLVYKHFGLDVVKQSMTRLGADASKSHQVWLKLYASFIEAIDGVDNGIERFESDKPPRYQQHTDLASRVGRLNPEWNADAADDDERMRRFEQAIALTGAEFYNELNHIVRVWLPARAIVESALAQRFTVHASGCVVELPRYCPWTEHLAECEAEAQLTPLPAGSDFVAAQRPLFVVFGDPDGSTRIAAVPVAPGSFTSRRALPAAWRGLREATLDAAAGVSGAVFVHANGFIGGARTRATALDMAIKALEQ